MKYIVTAKDVFKGDSKNDACAPTLVTEIATELIITRLKLIDMLQKGEATQNDIIVTIPERRCLYTKIFKSVWSRETATQFMDTTNTIDLLDESVFMRLAGGSVESREIPYLPFYRNWERDKDLITNVEWSSAPQYNTDKPFVVAVIRKRGAWPEKNMTDEFWKGYIENFKKSGIQLFVFGKETEMFADSPNIQHIKNFQDWCTLARHPNCKHVVSTMTGGVYPCLIFGAPNMKMTIIDNTNLMKHYSYDPSFYHPCINFSKVDIQFIDRIPNTAELYDITTKNL